MARDRFRDDEDDDDDRNRRLGGDRDDDYDDEPRRGSGDVARARGKVSVPGIFLVVCGLIALLMAVPTLVLSVVNPAWGATLATEKFVVPMLEMQPPSPQRDAAIQQARDDLKNKGDRVDPLSVGLNLVNAACAAAMALGGILMRSLKGYPLAVIGALAALDPFACCCLSFPVGVWALITLLNSDVKAGFSAAGRG